MELTDEEVAEMIARFRTPPGFSWEPLRDDIVTLLQSRRAAWEARNAAALFDLTSPLQ